MGDTSSARKSYEEFPSIWKDADTDIPIYREAKAEYARLEKTDSYKLIRPYELSLAV